MSALCDRDLRQHRHKDEDELHESQRHAPPIRSHLHAAAEFRRSTELYMNGKTGAHITDCTAGTEKLVEPCALLLFALIASLR